MATKEELFELYNDAWNTNDANKRKAIVDSAKVNFGIDYSQFNFEFHAWNARKRPDEYEYGPDNVKKQKK